MLDSQDVSTVRAIAYLLRNSDDQEFDAVCQAFKVDTFHVKREVSCYYGFCKFDDDQIIQRLIVAFESLQEFTLYYDCPESEWGNVILSAFYSTAQTEEEIRNAIHAAINEHVFLDGFTVESIDPLVQIVQTLRDNLKIS